jgi:heat shock protein HslJ
LLQKTWQLEWMQDQDGGQMEVLEGSLITLELGLGTVKGSSGCNTYQGIVQLVEGKIQIGPVATTMMACEEPIMEQELLYLERLQNISSLNLEGEKLVGKDDNGQVLLVFHELEALPLVGTLWEVVSYNNGQGAMVSVLAGSQITAQFSEEGQVSGNASCNRYFGSYVLEGENLTIGPLGSTEMFCEEPEGLMEQEQAFLAAMPTASTYQVTGDRLELRTADGTLAVSFTAVQPKPLEGTLWVLTGYNNGQGGFVSVLTGSEITALFSTDGTLSGSAGCNTYNAAFTREGDSLQIGPAAVTRMMCAEPEGVMEQESGYLNALGKVTSFSISGDQLTLLDESGNSQAQYVSHPLVGKVWWMTEIQYMNDTSVAPANPQDYTVQFLPDGALAIKADCNQVGGTYTLQGSSLSINLGASTMAFCGEESLDQQFLEQLSLAASYLIENGQLFIAAQMDSSIIQFVEQP